MADASEAVIDDDESTTAPTPSFWAPVCSRIAWGLLATVFGCAFYQGSEFASDKDSATLWGVVIGLAAYFAWLAVDLDEEANSILWDRGGEEDAEGEETDRTNDLASGSLGTRTPAVPAKSKSD